jgi:hypothetical protein
MDEMHQSTLLGNRINTTVVNLEREHCTRRIDRSTPFGNPYRLETEGGIYTPKQSIEAYREWFHSRIAKDASFREAVEGLRGEALGGWRSPRDSHGQVIVEYLEGPTEPSLGSSR